jgi:Asp-tRNA(Asn)/Glu-tRNA(Gln) amidotransferase A subunit family amidase
MTQPCYLTATQASDAIAAGKLSSEELIRSCLARVAAREAEVKAWSYIDHDRAVRIARELDKQEPRSRLHGIPVGVKDMIDTRDMPTQHNSPIYVGRRPNQDATVVAILRAAGAVILGKTDTHEFAAGGRLPATRNPHDLRRTPGGSSSGSAAAVADRHALFALGTQTAGSTIRPASFCGTAALKPTFGTLSREGAKFYSVSLDTLSLFANSISDLGLMTDVLAIARQPWRPKQSVRGLRFAVCRTPWWSKATAESQAAVENCASRLAKEGASVEALDLPGEFAAANDLQTTIMRGEGRAAFLGDYRNHYDLLHQDFRDRVEDSDGITPEKLRDALDAVAGLRPTFDRLASAFDAVLTPAAVGEAPPLSERTTGDPLFNRMWTALHVPCVATPWAKGPNGLPIGVQLVAPRYRDAELLGSAVAVEALAS